MSYFIMYNQPAPLGQVFINYKPHTKPSFYISCVRIIHVIIHYNSHFAPALLYICISLWCCKVFICANCIYFYLNVLCLFILLWKQLFFSNNQPAPFVRCKVYFLLSQGVFFSAHLKFPLYLLYFVLDTILHHHL